MNLNLITPQNVIYTGLVGLSSAMYLWLVAAGLTIAFGVLGVLNFAHGSLYMLGAYMAFTLYAKLGWNFWLSLALGAASIGLVGVVLERYFLKRIYHLDIAYQLILTFGFILIFSDLARIIWGDVFLLPPVPDVFDRSVKIVGRLFPVYNLFIIVAGVAVGVLVWLLLEKTWWGKTVRAAASDQEMASAIGVNTPVLFTTVFVFATLLAAFGGALSIPMQTVTPGEGTAKIVLAFIIAVIGGLGDLKGAFVGSLIVGLVIAYGTLLVPRFNEVFPYLLMALVLLFKPEGLLAKGQD
ncbi:MAG: branched-chain amino acid ABC transporter permease [Anaerolineae bacterium]